MNINSKEFIAKSKTFMIALKQYVSIARVITNDYHSDAEDSEDDCGVKSVTKKVDFISH